MKMFSRNVDTKNYNVNKQRCVEEHQKAPGAKLYFEGATHDTKETNENTKDKTLRKQIAFNYNIDYNNGCEDSSRTLDDRKEFNNNSLFLSQKHQHENTKKRLCTDNNNKHNQTMEKSTGNNGKEDLIVKKNNVFKNVFSSDYRLNRSASVTENQKPSDVRRLKRNSFSFTTVQDYKNSVGGHQFKPIQPKTFKSIGMNLFNNQGLNSTKTIKKFCKSPFVMMERTSATTIEEKKRSFETGGGELIANGESCAQRFPEKETCLIITTPSPATREGPYGAESTLTVFDERSNCEQAIPRNNTLQPFYPITNQGKSYQTDKNHHTVEKLEKTYGTNVPHVDNNKPCSLIENNNTSDPLENSFQDGFSLPNKLLTSSLYTVDNKAEHQATIQFSNQRKTTVPIKNEITPPKHLTSSSYDKKLTSFMSDDNTLIRLIKCNRQVKSVVENHREKQDCCEISNESIDDEKIVNSVGKNKEETSVVNNCCIQEPNLVKNFCIQEPNLVNNFCIQEPNLVNNCCIQEPHLVKSVRCETSNESIDENNLYLINRVCRNKKETSVVNILEQDSIQSKFLTIQSEETIVNNKDFRVNDRGKSTETTQDITGEDRVVNNCFIQEPLSIKSKLLTIQSDDCIVNNKDSIGNKKGFIVNNRKTNTIKTKQEITGKDLCSETSIPFGGGFQKPIFIVDAGDSDDSETESEGEKVINNNCNNREYGGNTEQEKQEEDIAPKPNELPKTTLDRSRHLEIDSYRDFLLKLQKNRNNKRLSKSLMLTLTSANTVLRRRRSIDNSSMPSNASKKKHMPLSRSHSMGSQDNTKIVNEDSDDVFYDYRRGSDPCENSKSKEENNKDYQRGHRRSNSADLIHEFRHVKPSPELHRRYRKWFNDHTKRLKQLPAILAEMTRSSSTGSMAKIEEETEEDNHDNNIVEEYDDRSSVFSFESNTTDQDQYSGLHNRHQQAHQEKTTHKSSTKMVVNRSDLSYRNSVLSEDSSPRNSVGESSIEEIHMQEQDLGSDAESLPSCGDSYTASDSPPESPELSFESNKKTTVERRISAPSICLSEPFQDEQYNTLRRRNSSVDCRTNKVRFHLEESFKSEESKYENHFHDSSNSDDDINDQSKTWTVDVQSQSNTTDEKRKISETTQRKRKTSVFSDTSEKSIEIMKNITNYSVARKTSAQNVINDSCIQTQNSRLHDNKDEKQRQKKQSLQENRSDRKISLQSKNCDRKTSLQDHRKLSLQVNDRKLSHQLNHERKISTDRKLSLQTDRKISHNDRKLSSTDRKISSSERKYSSNERKISFTDTVRAVVGTKKKSERKVSCPDPSSSPDENNNSNDKKTTWGLIKNQIKKHRKHSESSPKSSPRVISRQVSRNDSGSSNDSFRKRADSKNGRYGRGRTYSEQDRYSVSSFTSFELDVEQKQDQTTEKRHSKETFEIPPCSFDVWSEGKVDIKVENKTLPLLHVAAGEGNVTLLKTLLDVGVEVNEIDAAGWPALHYAVCGGHFECAQMLIEKGAILKSYSNKVTNSYCSAIRNCIMTPATKTSSSS